MPLSFGCALINRGTHLSIYRATWGAPWSTGARNFPSIRQLWALPDQQECAPFHLSGNFGRALINRGAHSSILQGKLKHTLSPPVKENKGRTLSCNPSLFWVFPCPPFPSNFPCKKPRKRSGFGFPNQDSRIFMQTPDSSRIRAVRYWSPPDPIEPQTSCMCEGYNYKALVTWNNASHISRIPVFLCGSGLPQTPFLPWTGMVWMVHNSNRSMPFGGRCQNAFWMPTVNECRQIRSVRFVRKLYEIRDWKDDIQIRHVDILREIDHRSTRKHYGQIHSEDI